MNHIIQQTHNLIALTSVQYCTWGDEGAMYVRMQWFLNYDANLCGKRMLLIFL